MTAVRDLFAIIRDGLLIIIMITAMTLGIITADRLNDAHDALTNPGAAVVTDPYAGCSQDRGDLGC